MSQERKEELAALKLKIKELQALDLEASIRKANAEAELAEVQALSRQRDEECEMASMNEHRIYDFVGAVTVSSVQDCMRMTGFWSRRVPGAPITIIFNSPGGSVIDGFALYDHIQELRQKGTDVTTVCRGYAASMGGVLLQAGTKRVIGDNAFVMIHEPSKMSIGKLFELEDELEMMKRFAARLANILAERSTLTADEIKEKWERRDWWLDANQVIELGLADEIG